MTLGIFWVGQQTQLNHLSRADRNLSWLHFVFLADDHGAAVLDAAARGIHHLSDGVPDLLVQHPDRRRSDPMPAGSMRSARASSTPTRRPAFRARYGGASSSRKRFMRSAPSLGLISIPLGIGFIVLVQLNYAIAPRLPFLFKL